MDSYQTEASAILGVHRDLVRVRLDNGDKYQNYLTHQWEVGLLTESGWQTVATSKFGPSALLAELRLRVQASWVQELVAEVIAWQAAGGAGVKA